MQSKPDSWWTYLTSMFDIATRYMLYVRHERTGCIVPDFPIQAPIYLYTKTAIMHRGMTELCRLITWWKHSIIQHKQGTGMLTMDLVRTVCTLHSAITYQETVLAYLQNLPTDKRYLKFIQTSVCYWKQWRKCKTNQNHSCAQSLQVSYACYNWGYR